MTIEMKGFTGRLNDTGQICENYVKFGRKKEAPWEEASFQ
jgi:hypothetical protein